MEGNKKFTLLEKRATIKRERAYINGRGKYEKSLILIINILGGLQTLKRLSVYPERVIK